MNENATRVIALAILLGTFVFCLTACSAQSSVAGTNPNAEINHNYEAFIVSCSDSIEGADHEIEMPIWQQGHYTDDTAKKVITKTINNETVQGEYLYTQKMLPNSFDRHFYRATSGSAIFFFLDDAGTLQYCTWDRRNTDPERTATCTEEECLAIAKDFIRTDVLKDINFDQYTVETSVDDDSGLYRFSFYKYIKGHKTTEEAHISVTKNGELYSFGSFMFGKISEEDFVEFDSEKVAQVIDKKLDAVYKNVRNGSGTVTYDKKKMFYTLLEDGEPALYCVVTVKFTLPAGNGSMVREELLGLIIK